jgi:hypothetical protein
MIERSAAILPLPLRPVQHLPGRAAVDLTPCWLWTILGLNEHGLYAWEAGLVQRAAAFVDRLVLESNPAVQACRRMRPPADYSYVNDSAVVAGTGPFQQVTRKSPIFFACDLLNIWITSGVGRNRTLQSFFAK